MITIHPLLCNKRFFLFAILSGAIQLQLLEKASGITAKGIKSSRLVHVLIPLPPLTEQAAIVQRVEELTTICRSLAAEIEHSRAQATNLLQAILKEAFAPASDPKAWFHLPVSAEFLGKVQGCCSGGYPPTLRTGCKRCAVNKSSLEKTREMRRYIDPGRDEF